MPQFRFTIRRMMVVVAIFTILFAIIYHETVGSYYGPGGVLDREYSEAERDWNSVHPGQKRLEPASLAPLISPSSRETVYDPEPTTRTLRQ